MTDPDTIIVIHCNRNDVSSIRRTIHGLGVPESDMVYHANRRATAIEYRDISLIHQRYMDRAKAQARSMASQDRGLVCYDCDATVWSDRPGIAIYGIARNAGWKYHQGSILCPEHAPEDAVEISIFNDNPRARLSMRLQTIYRTTESAEVSSE